MRSRSPASSQMRATTFASPPAARRLPRRRRSKSSGSRSSGARISIRIPGGRCRLPRRVDARSRPTRRAPAVAGYSRLMSRRPAARALAGPTIGITGTAGKTTTTALVATCPRSTRWRRRTAGSAGTSSSAITPTRRARNRIRNIARRSTARPPDGVLYPRAGTLGGCTAHNAMILVYPHNADWDRIAELTGERHGAAERCAATSSGSRTAAPAPRPLLAGSGRTRAATAGTAGCRPRRRFPGAAIRAIRSCRAILESAVGACGVPAGRSSARRGPLESRADPNDWRVVPEARRHPLHPADHPATPPRRDARARPGRRKQYPDRLKVELTRSPHGCCSTTATARSASNTSRARASTARTPAERRGGELRQVAPPAKSFWRRRLQHAAAADAVRRRAPRGLNRTASRCGSICRCRKEPAGPLRGRRRQPHDFPALERPRGRRLRHGDRRTRSGPKTATACTQTNGAVLSAIVRSSAERGFAGPVLFALLGPLRGLLPGLLGRRQSTKPNYLTWACSRRTPRTGAARCVSASRIRACTPPNQLPLLRGRQRRGAARTRPVVAGIRLARKLTAGLPRPRGWIARGGAARRRAVARELRRIRARQAWGHHASCTCPIGPRDGGGRLGSGLPGARHAAAAAWSTPRCFRAFRVSLSRARST